MMMMMLQTSEWRTRGEKKNGIIFHYLPICVTDGGGYIKGLADPIIDGTWWPLLKIELVGTNIVVDVCDMFDGPRLPYGLGDGAYDP